MPAEATTFHTLRVPLTTCDLRARSCTVWQVGFLNETDPARIAARLPQFEAAFDAVLLGDAPFDWLLGLLRGLR